MAKRKVPKRVKAKPRNLKAKADGILKTKHAAFVREFLIDRNATAAYLRAGYKNTPAAHGNAARLIANDSIRAAIAAAEAQAAVDSVATVARLELELERCALSDPRTLYRDDGSMKPPGEWDDATAATIASVEIFEEFEGQGEARTLTGHTKKVKRWDKVRACVELLDRRDDAGKAPPGSTPGNPLHVSLTLTQRLAELESAITGAADRAGQSPVPPDRSGEQVDP